MLSFKLTLLRTDNTLTHCCLQIPEGEKWLKGVF